MSLSLYQVDAFTDRPFAGNPAAVCLVEVCFKTLYAIAQFVSFSLLLGDCHAQTTVESDPAHSAHSKPALHRLTPPVRIVDDRAYGDGGTLSMRLADANNYELLFSVSQGGFEDVVPADTLFLDSWYPYYDLEARLPTSDEEVVIVLEALNAIVHTAFTDAELVELQDVKNLYAERWDSLPSNGRLALSVLRRLQENPKHAVLNREKELVPEWYTAYCERRQKRLAKIQEEEATEDD